MPRVSEDSPRWAIAILHGGYHIAFPGAIILFLYKYLSGMNAWDAVGYGLAWAFCVMLLTSLVLFIMAILSLFMKIITGFVIRVRERDND